MGLRIDWFLAVAPDHTPANETSSWLSCSDRNSDSPDQSDSPTELAYTTGAPWDDTLFRLPSPSHDHALANNWAEMRAKISEKLHELEVNWESLYPSTYESYASSHEERREGEPAIREQVVNIIVSPREFDNRNTGWIAGLVKDFLTRHGYDGVEVMIREVLGG